MNFGGDSVNVYAEAKSEYTRQLCQILAPAIQVYFLDLLKIAKEKDSDARRMLWNFQAILAEIPDWNQDKVLRETERIQRDSNCDYLEELLTAVFIAHTKVLSAIRITTKQKKLQITIPKIDHFVHRTLRETGRLLWGNAFLFAEQGSPIDRQKNMRQVETLIMEGIQQSIRSLLPVKTILREYLNEADDGEEEQEDEKPKEDGDVEEKAQDEVIIQSKEVEEVKVPKQVEPEVPAKEEPKKEEPVTLDIPTKTVSEAKSVVNIIKEEAPVKNEVIVPPAEAQQQQQPTTLVIDTVPSVGFTGMDTIFDSEHPEENVISESPHIEEDIDHVDVLDMPPEPLDGFEDLETGSTGGIEFEQIA